MKLETFTDVVNRRTTLAMSNLMLKEPTYVGLGGELLKSTGELNTALRNWELDIRSLYKAIKMKESK